MVRPYHEILVRSHLPQDRILWKVVYLEDLRAYHDEDNSVKRPYHEARVLVVRAPSWYGPHFLVLRGSLSRGKDDDEKMGSRGKALLSRGKDASVNEINVSSRTKRKHGA